MRSPRDERNSGGRVSWGEIAQLGAKVRPLSEPRPPAGNKDGPFSASFSSTVDGMPRSNAQVSHPGVAVAFESKFGPLRYATAEYASAWGYRSGGEAWQQNLRAIALAMEALRKVDRYGVSKRGEQYQGWKQIPRSTDTADQIQTAAQARELLDHYGGLKEALFATHPDKGGDPDEYRRVIRAKELIEA